MAPLKPKQAASQWLNYLHSLVDFDSLTSLEMDMYNRGQPYFSDLFGMSEYKTLDKRHMGLLQGVTDGLCRSADLANYIQCSPPAVYPLLSILVTRGLVIVTTVDKKAHYRMSPFGKKTLAEYIEANGALDYVFMAE